MQVKQIRQLYLCSSLVLLVFSTGGIAQEFNESASNPRHSIALILGHAQIVEGIDGEGKKEWLSLPSWGLDYNYEINERWAIGLHNDIIIEEFVVEELGGEDVIERSFPIATAVVASYQLGEHFKLLSGLGGEFAREDSFLLARLGLEYGMEITESWELVANLFNDLKVDAYNSFGIGIGVAHKF